MVPGLLSPRLVDVEQQLDLAEVRCETLRGQLDYMKSFYSAYNHLSDHQQPEMVCVNTLPLTSCTLIGNARRACFPVHPGAPPQAVPEGMLYAPRVQRRPKYAAW